jgi:two-component system sensor histidine kinase QseC
VNTPAPSGATHPGDPPVGAPTGGSLWRHLWWWAWGALLAVWVTLVGVSYHTGAHEADEIADGQLHSLANHWLALPATQWPDAAPPAGAPRKPGVIERKRPSYTSEWALVLMQGDRLRLDTHGVAGLLPTPLRPGAQRRDLPGLPGPWHVWVQSGPADEPGGMRRVIVLAPTQTYTALGRDIAEHVARPALVMLPLVAALLAWALRRGLRPLRRLAAQVEALDLRGGERLPDERRFIEVQGMVNAIHTLIDDLQGQMRRERGFTSDVAHELRTPLTAVVWQAQRARQGQGEEQAQALDEVERQALRAGRILSQLLDLARAQGLDAQALQPVALGELAAKVLADHAQQAHEGRRELALQDDTALRLPGHPLMLELALRNLVDNALRHTPEGTQVLVRVWEQEQGAGIDVLDDGSGPTLRHAARADSGHLGIGLTLVRRIAELHGARLLPAPPIDHYRHGYRLAWPPVAPVPAAAAAAPSPLPA